MGSIICAKCKQPPPGNSSCIHVWIGGLRVPKKTIANSEEALFEEWSEDKATYNCPNGCAPMSFDLAKEAWLARAEIAKRNESMLAEDWHKLFAECNERIDQLEEALREARVVVEDWAEYASDYFRRKYNLKGDLARIDEALEDT